MDKEKAPERADNDMIIPEVLAEIKENGGKLEIVYYPHEPKVKKDISVPRN